MPLLPAPGIVSFQSSSFNSTGIRHASQDIDTVQADVAVDYFELRGRDTLKKLLDTTVAAFQQSFDLTTALYETGIGAEEAVAQAETQLEATQAQDAALGIQRAQFEHAIAML